MPVPRLEKSKTLTTRLVGLVVLSLLPGCRQEFFRPARAVSSSYPYRITYDAGVLHAPGARILTGDRIYVDTAPLSDTDLALVAYPSDPDTAVFFFFPAVAETTFRMHTGVSLHSASAYLIRRYGGVLPGIWKETTLETGFVLRPLSSTEVEVTNTLYRWALAQDSSADQRIMLQPRGFFLPNFRIWLEQMWGNRFAFGGAERDTLLHDPQESVETYGAVSRLCFLSASTLPGAMRAGLGQSIAKAWGEDPWTFVAVNVIDFLEILWILTEAVAPGSLDSLRRLVVRVGGDSLEQAVYDVFLEVIARKEPEEIPHAIARGIPRGILETLLHKTGGNPRLSGFERRKDSVESVTLARVLTWLQKALAWTSAEELPGGIWEAFARPAYDVWTPDSGSQGCGGGSGDLVAYYPMDGDARDQGGGGYHGVIYGGVSATSDRYGNPGQALAMDGTGYIELPLCALPEMLEGTVMAWIYLDTLGIQHAIMDKSQTGVTTDFQLIVDQNNKIRLNIDVRYGEVLRLYSSTTLQESTWYHVAVTWDGVVWKIYLNGQLDAEDFRDRTVPSTSRPVYVGKVSNETSFFQGAMDELRIFQRALTAEEIRYWMQQ